jgi:hypothetical protein
MFKVSKKFRKKPVIIEAMQFDGTWESARPILAWMGYSGPTDNNAVHWVGDSDPKSIYINTLEGKMTAMPGDWIIRGVQGEFYPCKPKIFDQTYEPVEE